MTINELVRDFSLRYMRIGTRWILLTYMLTMIFTVTIVVYSKHKNHSVNKCVLLVILFFYMTTIYMSTVMARWYKPDLGIKLKPFLSWARAYAGDRYSRKMVIENLIMLMPVGFFLSFIDRKKYYYIRISFFCFLFSLIIEISQYLRKTGLFEVDDLINNTLGGLIGCVLASLVLKLVQSIIEKKV